jgi:DNA-binding response OmpR family regulator
VVEAVHSKGRRVPVIMMSGYTAESVRPSASSRGYALLHKPFHPDELALAVTSALLEPSDPSACAEETERPETAAEPGPGLAGR